MSDEAPQPPVAPVAPVENPPGVDGEPTRLPDNHPLVTAFNTQKAELAAAKARLKEIDDANLTEAEKTAARIAELEQQNRDLALTSVRNKIAAEKGVPAELLTGTTEEELNAIADALAAWRGGQTPPAPVLPGNPKTAGKVHAVGTTDETPEQRRDRLAKELKR